MRKATINRIKKNRKTLSFMREHFKRLSINSSYGIGILDPHGHLSYLHNILTEKKLQKTFSFNALDELIKNKNKMIIIIYHYEDFKEEDVLKIFKYAASKNLHVITFAKKRVENKDVTNEIEDFEKEHFHTYSNNELNILTYIDALLELGVSEGANI